MGLREDINKALDGAVKNYPRLTKMLKFLRKDKEVKMLLEISNTVVMHRLGYNDHGHVHGSIVAFNAMKAINICYKTGIMPSIIIEDKKGTIEDALEIMMMAGFLHDIGNAITRDQHELHGLVRAKPIIDRYYIDNDSKNDKICERKKCLILEAVGCHMGTLTPSSLEARILPIADACDMEQGRARIPYLEGKKDIHSLSALAIKMVRIRKGEKKPLKIYVEMDSSAGIFQIEELLIKKIKVAQMEELVEISANILSRNEFINYFV